MSGPKVVRIVSREELVAQCEGLLAGLEAAREEWVRVGRRNELLADAEISAARERHAAIRNLLTLNRFAEVRLEVSAELAALQDDMHQRLAAAATAAAEARSAERRRSQVAEAVLSALEAAKADVPAELFLELKRAAAGEGEGGAAIANGFALLSKVGSPALTERQRELALALKDSDVRRSADVWQGADSQSPLEELLGKVDGYIATLRGLTDSADCEPFETRATQLAATPDTVRLAPKLDSLVVELARAVDKARARLGVQARVRTLAAELRQLATAHALAEADAAAQVMEGPVELLKQAEARAGASLERLRQEAAAHTRRQAVLKGLASLGYEVTEQMETAWVANGRVVLRQTARPDYGVEIGGGGDAERVQLRTVAFREATAVPDAARDRDAETIWCGELGKLRERFAQDGGEIRIEQALGVGAAPLRSVGSLSERVQRVQQVTRASSL